MTSPKRAFSDPHTGDRIYIGTDPRDRYESVTSIIGGATPKQHVLVPWAAKVVAEVAVELMMDVNETILDPSKAPDWLLEYGDSFDGIDYEGLADGLKHAWEWERDGAGELGDEVHEAAEELFRKSEGDARIFEALLEAKEATLSSDAYTRLGMVVPLLQELDVKVVRCEYTVYNDTYGYAGSCDLAAYVEDSPFVIDIKTGKQVYPEVALQLAAYARGEYCLPDESDDKLEIPFAGVAPNLRRGAVLHIGKRTASLKEVDVSDEVFDSFTSLMLVKRLWVNGASKEVLSRKPLWKLGR